MKKVLIIGAGAMQIPGITRAQTLGYKVIAMDGNPQAPGLRIADESFVIDIKDCNAIVDLARRSSIHGVCTIAVEAAVPAVAAVASALGLKGLSQTAAINSTNKHHMRRLWAENKVPSPQSLVCSSIEDAGRHAARLGWPFVLKPADSAGSRGVSLVGDALHLSDAFTAAHQASPSGTVLAETFMPGVEMSVEAFVFDGRFYPLACSDKARTPPPYLLDTAVIFPSAQPTGIQNAALQLVERAADVLGIDNAPIHAEVMVTPEGPMMVELAARGPGFKVFTDLIPWVTGIDVVEMLLRTSMGETPNFNYPKSRGAVLEFPSVKAGKIKTIRGIQEARSAPGVRELEIYRQPGEIVPPLTSGADRIGHFIVFAETRSEAVLAANTAKDILTFEIHA